jgi:hypothetical protein
MNESSLKYRVEVNQSINSDQNRFTMPLGESWLFITGYILDGDAATPAQAVQLLV